MKWAWDVMPGSATGRLVLLALAEHSDPAGVSFPSIKRIAQFAMTSEGTVKRRLKEFEAAGVVAVFERTDPRSGRTTSNEYRLALTKDPTEFVITDGAPNRVSSDADSDDESASGAPREGSTVDPSPPLGGSHPGESGEGVTQVNPLEPSDRTITPLPPESEPDGETPAAPFSAFTALWPVPLGKDATACELLWDALLPIEQMRVVGAVPQWAKACAKRGGPRLGRASQFLKSRLFDDPKLRPPPPDTRVWVEADTPQHRAWSIFRYCLTQIGLLTYSGARGGKGWHAPSEWPPMQPPGTLALPYFREGACPDGWTKVRKGTPNWWAWQHWLRDAPKPIGWNFDGSPLDRTLDGWCFPAPWPPRKDGTFAEPTEAERTAEQVEDADREFLERGGSL